MKQNIYPNRLDLMFNQLNNYNNNINIRLIEKDLKHYDQGLNIELKKMSKPKTANVSQLFNSPFKKDSKFPSVPRTSYVDALADNIIAKLKKRDQLDNPDPTKSLQSFYKAKTNMIFKDSKNSTQSFRLTKTNFQDTTYTEKLNTPTEENFSPRQSINKLLKQKLSTKDVKVKPIKLMSLPTQNELDKVIPFKTNSGINKYLIRDYTMGQYSTANSKRNLSITETFYDNIKKRKQSEMKEDMRKFYVDKYGDGVIVDNSFSSIEQSKEQDSSFEKFNQKTEIYKKVKPTNPGKNKRKIKDNSPIY
jgi:hypothetical protein